MVELELFQLGDSCQIKAMERLLCDAFEMFDDGECAYEVVF